jgi:hypothetical protein
MECVDAIRTELPAVIGQNDNMMHQSFGLCATPASHIAAVLHFGYNNDA